MSKAKPPAPCMTGCERPHGTCNGRHCYNVGTCTCCKRPVEKSDA